MHHAAQSAQGREREHDKALRQFRLALGLDKRGGFAMESFWSTGKPVRGPEVLLFMKSSAPSPHPCKECVSPRL